MFNSIKPTDAIAEVARIPPSSSAAAQTSGWVPVQNFLTFLAIIKVGAFGANATVDANIQQAQDNTGTGAKAIGTGKAITQLLAAGGNNLEALINLRQEELDTNNGFAFIQLTITVGTAASLVDGTLLGVGSRFSPPVDATANPAINLGAASVQQIVL